MRPSHAYLVPSDFHSKVPMLVTFLFMSVSNLNIQAAEEYYKKAEFSAAGAIYHILCVGIVPVVRRISSCRQSSLPAAC